MTYQPTVLLMATTIGLVLDCADPDRLSHFWSAAMGYTILQRVPEPKSGKNRMHFDIETPWVDTEVARLEALGARRISDEAVQEHGNRWVVMADPEGNEFCVCNAGQAG